MNDQNLQVAHDVQVTYSLVLDDRFEPIKLINASLTELGATESLSVKKDISLTVKSPRQLTDAELSHIKGVADEKVKHLAECGELTFVSITQRKSDDCTSPEK